MASPQLENGYVKIANEIMDALCRCDPGGSESQVLWAIMRKTFGWNKKCDKISISQLSGATGLARRTVIYALKNLEAKNMITIVRTRIDDLNDVNLISLQKDCDKWVVQEIDGSARKCKSYKATIEKQKENYKNKKALQVVQEIDGSARKCKKVVQENVNHLPFLAPTKDTITKDIIQKKIFMSDSIEIRLSEYLFKHILRNNENAKEPNHQYWAKTFDLMIRVDKRTPEQIKALIQWSQKSEFWFKVILSPQNLRRQYDRLTLEMSKVPGASEESRIAIEEYIRERNGGVFNGF